MKLFNLMLEDELKDDLKQTAAELNLTMAAVLRISVIQFIEEHVENRENRENKIQKENKKNNLKRSL